MSIINLPKIDKNNMIMESLSTNREKCSLNYVLGLTYNEISEILDGIFPLSSKRRRQVDKNCIKIVFTILKRKKLTDISIKIVDYKNKTRLEIITTVDEVSCTIEFNNECFLCRGWDCIMDIESRDNVTIYESDSFDEINYEIDYNKIKKTILDYLVENFELKTTRVKSARSAF